MEVITETVSCQCCRYKAEVSTQEWTSTIIRGRIICEQCVMHFIWNKFWHRISLWWWWRKYDTHD